MILFIVNKVGILVKTAGIMCGSRKFCQSGSNSDNVYFFLTDDEGGERIQITLKADHH